MGFLDRLLGRSDDRRPTTPGMTGGSVPRGYASPTQAPQWQQQGPPGPSAARTPDDVAIDRYRYLLRTAPPDAVEQAHAEAFEQLTPEQRRQVLAEVGATLPPTERATSDDPRSLARMATRAEMRSPGTLERTFRGGAPGGAPGFGAMVGSSLLGTVAGVVIGSAVANMLFGPAFGDPTTPVAEDAAAAEGGDAGGEDPGAADAGGDAGAADAGADDSMFGGFFGGGDGGGGDFGGGDFGGF